MAIDANELPAVDPDSFQRFQSEQLEDYADTALKKAVTPTPDLAAPLPAAQASSIAASAPAPVTTPPEASGETMPAPAQPTPAPEPVAVPPAEHPAWLPESAKRILTQNAQQPLATQDPSKADVLGIGSREIGKPYAGPIVGQPESARWGSVGWDCSSFVSGVYGKVGVKLPAFTDAIASQTPLVKPGDERPGDIILYKYRDPYQPGVQYPHTALLVGDGKMLDAAYGQGVGIHPMLDRPYEIHRPVGVTPNGSVAALSQGGIAGKVPATVAPNINLPPVDVDSANQHSANGLQQFATDRLAQVQQAPQSFMDWVTQRVSHLGLPNVTGFKPDVPIDQQSPSEAPPGSIASRMPLLPGEAGPPSPGQLGTAELAHPDLTSPLGIHQFSGALGEAAGGSLHAALPQAIQNLPVLQGVMEQVFNPEFAPGSATNALVGAAMHAGLTALKPVIRAAAPIVETALKAQGIDLSVLGPTIANGALASITDEALARGIDIHTLGQLDERTIGSLVGTAIQRVQDTAASNGVSMNELLSHAGMGAGVGVAGVREADPNAGPGELAVAALTGAAFGGGAAMRGATIGAGIRTVAGADAVRATNPRLASIIEGFNGVPAQPALRDRLAQIGQAIERQVVDRLAPINKLGPQAEEAAGTYAGRAGAAWQDVEDKLAPVYNALDANKGRNQSLVDQFNAYVGLQRYLEVAREKGTVTGAVDAAGRAILKRNGPSGITDTGMAESALRDLETAVGPEGMARIQQADELRQQAMHDLLRDKVDTGFLTQQTADELEAKYPHYNPVSVLQAINESPGPISGKALTQVGNTIKRLTEEGSEFDQLPATQSAALAISTGRTNIIRNETVSTIARSAGVPIKPAQEIVTGRNINVGTKLSTPAKALISDAQAQRIADLQYKMGNTVMTAKSQKAAQQEIDGIMRQASLVRSTSQATEIVDPDLLKTAPRQSNTFNRSPGAGGSGLTPANFGNAVRNVSLGRNGMPDANPIASIMTSVRNDPEGYVSLWKGGKRYLADFTSMPEVAKSLRALDENGLSIVGRIAQVMNAPLRAGATTLSIPFQLRNAFFDAVDAYARSGIKPWGENGIIRGYVDAATKSEAYRAYIAGGGGMGGFFAKQPTLGNLLKENVNPAKAAAQMEKELRASGGIQITSPGDVLRLAKQFGIDLVTFTPLRKVGEIIEQGPRMAAFRQSFTNQTGLRSSVLDLGPSAREMVPREIQTATLAGRRITVDFSRMGTAMREINAIIPFSNAALQGTLNMGRSLGIGQRAGFMGTAANKATAMRYSALTGAVASVYAWNRQFQDRYQDVPEYVRANSLVIMLPGGEKNPPGTPGWKSNPYVAMPLREIGALPYLVTKGLEKLDGQNPDFGPALMHAFQGVSPVPDVATPANLLGAPAKAIAEQRIGKGGWDTFRGREIVSEKLQGLPAGVQATPQTSPTVVDMAHLINRSPAQAIVGEQSPVRMERFIQDTTGGLGKTVLDAADTLGGKPADTPPVVGGALTGIYKNYGGETEQRMYQERDVAITKMDAEHRDLLETLAKDGAPLGPPPSTIENIPLHPPEQAMYRQLQLNYLANFFHDHPDINARLAAIPNDTPQRIALRSQFLKEIVNSGNELVQGRVLQSIGPEELRARLLAANEGDARNLYPQKEFAAVGA